MIRRYLRLYRVFARNNLVREMEFRGNFWANILTNIGWLVAFSLFLEIVFRNTEAIGGWSKAHVFLLFGTFLFVRSMMDTLFTQNLSKIPELIRMGTMDFVLTKPVPSQFYVSARYLSLGELGSLLGAGAVLGYGLHLSGIVPTALQVLAWLYLSVCGLAILYAIQLLLMTLSFWLIRLDNLTALSDTVIFIARYPPDIFPKLLAMLLTYVLPLAFIAAVPTRVFREGVHWQPLLVAFGKAFLFALAASWFWRFATRAYTSASS